VTCPRCGCTIGWDCECPENRVGHEQDMVLAPKPITLFPPLLKVTVEQEAEARAAYFAARDVAIAAFEKATAPYRDERLASIQDVEDRYEAAVAPASDEFEAAVARAEHDYRVAIGEA